MYARSTSTIGLRSRGKVILKRCSSVQVPVFDSALKNRQREWALGQKDGRYYDYLRDESVRRMVDRLEDITRDFPQALELGSYRGYMLHELSGQEGLRGAGGIGGIQHLTQFDTLPYDSIPTPSSSNSSSSGSEDVLYPSQNTDLVDSSNVEGDFTALPFADHTFDVVLTAMSLHWVNDLQLALSEVKRVLKPDGAFIGSMLGGSTLTELKHCFYLAELDRRGGFAPHVSPLARASDVASLMQGAGFALPTVDVDTIQIGYPSAIALMEHLALMGEGSAALNRQFCVGRDSMLAMAAIYQEMYGNEDGSVTASFELVSFIGWSPHSSQPKACRRGSAQASIKDSLGE